MEHGEIQRVGALQAKRVDVNVIAATNRDLLGASAAGRFRPDLYYRLNVVQLHVPPLRDRRDDIPYLVAAFVRECGARMGKPLTGVTAGAERALRRRPARNVPIFAAIEPPPDAADVDPPSNDGT